MFVMAGLPCLPLRSGYSGTIGNLAFDLPDAAMAAAEIARRGIADIQVSENFKERLPAVPSLSQRRRWKDDAR